MGLWYFNVIIINKLKEFRPSPNYFEISSFSIIGELFSFSQSRIITY